MQLRNKYTNATYLLLAHGSEIYILRSYPGGHDNGIAIAVDVELMMTDDLKF